MARRRGSSSSCVCAPTQSNALSHASGTSDAASFSYRAIISSSSLWFLEAA